MKLGFNCIFVLLLTLFCVQCAKRSTPNGGPKDSIPPVLVNANPKLNSVFFDKEEIELTFDEYITLKEISKQLIISPPMERDKYKIFPQSGASKKINIELLDTLLSNTTYTFNFGSSIFDYNESNPMPYFSYTISTGAIIDSLNVKGRIDDAFEKEPESFISLQLYPIDSTYTDSTVFLKKPFYITSTLDTTLFNFRNLKEGIYEIIALEDVSGNYLFDQNVDKIAFSETPITLPQDSVINLRLFKEIANFEWAKPFFINEHHIGIGYYGEIQDQSFEMISPVPDSFETLITKNQETDTLNYWFKGAALDSLKFEFIVQDTLRTDNVQFRNPIPDSLVIKEETKGSLKLTEKFLISSNLPIVKTNTDHVVIRNIDSIAIPFSMRIEENYDKITLDFEVLPNDRYDIELYPMALEDFWGNTNDSLSFSVMTKKVEDFGNIFIRLVHDQSVPFILELLDTQGKIVQSYDELSDSGVYPFLLLPPGTFSLRFIEDLNGNKQWDTGNYLKKIQPENVIYLPIDLDLRANWDLNEMFNPTEVEKNRFLPQVPKESDIEE